MSVLLRRKKMVKECDAGGACAPTATVNNVGGIGNAVPAQMAAMTAADQCNPASIGSGDRFDNGSKIATQASAPKKGKKVKFRKSKR